MTGPGQRWDVLPPWKVRLLEETQQLWVEGTHLLRRGHPTYASAHGDNEFQIQSWRRRLRAPDAVPGEAEIHSRAGEIPPRLIEAAPLLGRQGLRWADRDPAPTKPPRGRDADRARIIDILAEDVWHLEHPKQDDAAIIDALPDELDLSWSAEPATEPDPGPPRSPQHDAGREP